MADALVKRDDISALFCPVGGGDCMKAVAAYLGKAAAEKQPEVATVRCGGTCEKRPRTNEYNGAKSCAVASSLYVGETGCAFGCLGFGGPAGQIALMHRTVVDEKRWVDDARFLHALNYCTLLPGPEAQQLATYVGWLLHRPAGGIAAGTLFVLPGFCVVMALSFIYAAYSQIPAIDALFWGLKPAVLAVVLEALLRVGRRSLRDGFSLALAGVAFAALFAFGVPFPAVVFGAGLLGWLRARYAPATGGANGDNGHKGGTASHAPVRDEMPHGNLPLPAIRHMPDHARPSTARALRVLATWLPLWLGPVLLLGLLLGWDSVYARMGVFFSKMAVVTFGGAYAVLAYVAQQAVEAHGWLSMAEFTNLVTIAEMTPGPISINSATFVGPRLCGVPGAVICTLGCILAPFIICLTMAHFYYKYRNFSGVQNVLGALRPATVALIGSAGVSAVPMAARVSQKVGQKENPTNFLLMHAMGPNVSGVIGSAVAAGVLLAILKPLV